MAVPIRLSEQTIEGFYDQGFWQPYTIADLWHRHAAAKPDATALSEGARQMTWAEAKDWSDRVAMGLVGLGLERDAVVLLQLPNNLEVPLLRIACEKAGLLCLSVARTLNMQEILHCVRHTQAQAAIIPHLYRDFDYFQMMYDVQRQLPHLSHILVMGDEAPLGGRALGELLAGHPDEGLMAKTFAERHFRPDEVSIIGPTTGSTGLPKFCEYPAAARLLYGRVYIETLDITGDDVIAALSSAPGPNIPVYFSAPQVGAKTVLLEHFDVEGAFDLMEQEKVTIACVVPAQLALMVRHPRAREIDSSALRYWVSAGAVMPENVARQAEEIIGGIMVNSFGAHDWGGAVLTSPQDSPEVRRSTAGKPRGGAEMRLVDDQGKQVAGGEMGELQGRGPMCCTGYYGDPQATADTWDGDGWRLLGDIGQWTERGDLVLVGRKQDLIIRGAQNIQPSEIENHILAHPKVRQAVVVGMPDAILGERVCAFVVPQPQVNITMEEIQGFLREKGIAIYKLPERFEVLEKMPMISDIKVDRRALRDLVSGHPEQES